MAEDEFVYVRPVEGKGLVARYGSGGRGRRNMVIGATRTDEGYEVDARAVVRIPRAEWGRYRKEYKRAVDGGALKVVGKKAYDAAQRRAAKAAAPPAPEAAVPVDADGVPVEIVKDKLVPAAG